MAFGRLERSPVSQPLSEINMTPLIDVMLVLLVIFIVTAPLIGSSLKLELPRSDAAGPAAAPVVLRVALDADGQLFVDDEPVARERLVQRAREAAARDPGAEVHLRADRRVPYGRVAEVLGWVQGAGLTRIGFITEAQRE
jgi:biopolymer transport protein ExbD